MKAVLFKASTTVKVTNYESDISFGGETYVSDQSLIGISGPGREGDFPSYQFEILCRSESAQRALFVQDTGPEPASIFVVEAVFDANDGSLSWNELFAFHGILSRGSLVDDVYSGDIEHQLAFRFYAPPRRYWNSREQQLRTGNSDDLGAEHVPTISQGLASDWQGTRMSHN